MNIISLNKENITAYQVALAPDIAENIGRIGYYGIADVQGGGVLVWRRSSITGNARMLDFKADDAQIADELLAEYELRLRDARIAKSELELPADLGTVQREALERAGYELSEGEGKVLHTTVAYLAKLPVAARCQLPDTVGSTGMLSIRQFHQGILGQTKAGALEDAGALSPKWFDSTLSSCIQIEGKVCGFLLIHKLPSGAIRPEVFYIIPPAVNHNLLDMIRYVIFRAQENLEGDTPVIIPRYSDDIRALTDKLLPGLQGDTVIRAVKELSGNGE